MKDIQKFIQAKFYTVPLNGKLYRDKYGKKNTPYFPRGWTETYSKEINQEATEIGALITGEATGIIGVDCDNELTWDLFRSLDPDYEFYFKSVGKPEGQNGGTLIYQYEEPLISFKIHDEELQLDLQSKGCCVYLPTASNTTKETWDENKPLPELKYMPRPMKMLLESIQKKNTRPSLETKTSLNSTVLGRLEPLVTQFVNTGEVGKTLFRIITPNDFRTKEQYVKEGYLHPENIGDGNRNNYMCRVSAILASDISINEELYTKAMNNLNDLLDPPLDQKELEDGITNRVLAGTATIDNGDPLWQYDPDWKSKGVVGLSNHGDPLELFYDDARNQYVVANLSEGYYHIHVGISKALENFSANTRQHITKPQAITSYNIRRITLDPSKVFGHVEETGEFNLFKPSPALSILQKPEIHVNYKRPETILDFFNHFVADEEAREYLIRFLKTKLETFKYSPVVPYIIGVMGSGKDTFCDILSSIVGRRYFSKPTVEDFISKYNGWVVDTFFSQLDEYGDSVNAHNRSQVLAKIKQISGKRDVSVRRMHTDLDNDAVHRQTMIMTSNSNPLQLETGDRRLLYIQTLKPLIENPMTMELGLDKYHENLKAEIYDFMYYLATEVEQLPMNDYHRPPMTETKREAIKDSLNPSGLIANCLKTNDHEGLKELSEDYNVPEVFRLAHKCMYATKDLHTLYKAMSGENPPLGTTRSFHNFLKSSQGIFIKKSDVTVRPNEVIRNCYFVPVNENLKAFWIDEPVKAEEGSFTMDGDVPF